MESFDYSYVENSVQVSSGNTVEYNSSSSEINNYFAHEVSTSSTSTFSQNVLDSSVVSTSGNNVVDLTVNNGSLNWSGNGTGLVGTSGLLSLSNNNIGLAGSSDSHVLVTGSQNISLISQNSTVLESSAISAIEQAILRANNPIEVNETEVITVNGQTGVWANKTEIINWKGVIPITEYAINEDLQPEIITKRSEQLLTYQQEIAVRYLRPPTPPPPGDIIIKAYESTVTPPAPPLVIRQQPPRPETPAPLVIREAPPKPPVAIGQKVITISGKRLPPPPRKVVIERLPAFPIKPQSVMIERWLPYSSAKRKVIFQKSTEADPIITKPRNVVIQWEAPQVQIKKQFKDLGVIRANPVEYVQTYGATLKTHTQLPDFVREIRPPSGIVLAAESTESSFIELEGDLESLKIIDLDREGLSEYKTWLARTMNNNPTSFSGSNTTCGVSSVSFDNSKTKNAASIILIDIGKNNKDVSLKEYLETLNQNFYGNILRSECENVFIQINRSLGRNYSESDLVEFFKNIKEENDGRISNKEFENAIKKYINLW